uniref:Uncharacterized protein n=1 Tax=viral metagenome TaxID=1070528 RepID=A0A6C0BL81_9ZZZZ
MSLSTVSRYHTFIGSPRRREECMIYRVFCYDSNIYSINVMI